ncbi:4a-hydroxytetrahydrobiopterin dehydratase [Streptomyces sp. NPDC005529]|uniref:4a-hydroxytetrahydrobiopterin dehydratase n=1 Tax=unclassified Streptomyces TaxID=2593676 RepID=UPI00339F661A
MSASMRAVPNHSTPKDHSACHGHAGLLSVEQVAQKMSTVPYWELRQGRLVRTFHCESFPASMAFVQAVADTAQEVNHHPNLSVEDKRRVGFVLWTHKSDGLTSLDFDLATRIDAIHRRLTGAGG